MIATALDPYEHLDERVRSAALGEDARRLALISADWWIPYPPGEDVIARLFDMIDAPQRMRPPSVLVHAPPNSGKSAIIARFAQLYAARVAQGAAEPDGIVIIQAPPTVDEKRLYIEILTAIGASAPDTTCTRLRGMVVRQLRIRGVRLLIIDEMQHILIQRPSAQQVVLNTLKYLSNELGLSIAGFGSSETRALVYADEHLTQRFDIVALPAWDKKHRWVVDIIRQRIALLPLRQASTIDRDFMNLLLQVCGPIGGRMLDMLERCARAAIKDGSERLSASLLEEVRSSESELSMGFDRSDAATLAVPLVKREEGEALSSWLARIAREHLLTLEEVAAETGCAVAVVDHISDPQMVSQIARRTGVPVGDVESALHLNRTSRQPVRQGEVDWRICAACLAADREAGRAPHVRAAWTHMLATVCLDHEAPLIVPSGHDCGDLLPDDEPWRPREDHGLRNLEGEPLGSLLMAARLVCPSQPSNEGDALLLEQEVFDLVDALSVQCSYALGPGAVLSLFEQPRRCRHVRPLSLHLPEAILLDMDTADRLLFVRAALAVRWPSPDNSIEREMLGDWLSRVATLVLPKARRRVIDASSLDPLGLLAVALPIRPFHQMRVRSAAWSIDLRQRWAAAEQIAALAGLN